MVGRSVFYKVVCTFGQDFVFKTVAALHVWGYKAECCQAVDQFLCI